MKELRIFAFNQESFMRLRHLWFVALTGFALTPLAHADDKPASPSLVVQLKSIDGLMADAKYFSTLVDREDEVKNIEGIIQTFTNEQGLGGIDTKRPFALYGSFDKDNIQASP